MLDYIADGQTTIFDMLYPTFKIDKPIRLIELFAGVGSQAMALRDLGADFEHHRIAEWEVSAFKSYKAIHMLGDNTDYSKDISKDDLPQILFNYGISTNGKDPMTLKEIQRKGEKWQRETYNNIKATNNLCSVCNFKGEDLGITDTDKYCYILTYSFPCQDLSVAGKMQGMAKGSGTRSGLLWEVERLLGEVKELPQVLLMENVPQVISDANIADFHKWQDFLTEKGYTNYVEVLNAKDFGVAQNRERAFMVSILGKWNYKFPKPIPLTKTMADYLEDEVDEKYYINSEKAQQLILQLIESGQLGEQKDNNIPCKLDKPYIDGKFVSMTSDELALRDIGTETAGTITARYHKGLGSNGDNAVITKDKICIDLSINNPKVTNISNCITARQDRGISNHQGVGGAVVEQVKQIGGIYTNQSPNFQRGILEGMSRSLKAEQHDAGVVEKVKIKQATQQGYVECKLGGVADLSYPTSKTRRGRVQDNGDTCHTLTASETGICRIETPYRIRKLTPRECWRLMDFTDKDYEKAEAVNSNTQLYKQAGNSIVKAVLMAIFKQMLVSK